MLPVQGGTLCRICGEDLGIATFSTGNPRPEEDCVCRVCRMDPPPFRRAVAHGAYQGTLRTLIHSLKYERITPVSNGLGHLLASAMAQLAAETPSEMLVVPVPLHRSKRRTRGYNQAELLTQAALKVLRRTHPEWKLRLASEVLVRSRRTATQFELSARQRRDNVRGVFSVPEPRAVAGRDILLVDDIYTTGATARACSKTLLKAGAASVWVATLARAQREGVAFWDPKFGKTAVSHTNVREMASSPGS